ncbi:MAG TPA: flagellar hook-basal body protein [Opitutaceae bacterium]|nr:flagellar hook-basal body protein [Opitutaceae bacterium]
MNIGVYQSAASISALERWQDAVSQNIASSQVSGYKKRTIDFAGVNSGQIKTDPNARLDRDEGQPAMFPKASYGINFQQGDTTPTHRELDVALQSTGFFEVQTPTGSHAYTRNGSFHLTPDRMLVDSAKNQVLSDGGNPIQFPAQGGEISINQDGIITQGTTQVGRLGVVKFANTSLLSPIGAGLFVPTTGVSPQPLDAPNVLQGQLEGSNITPLREMVDLVTISRAYESNQKMITSSDEIMQKTLEALG